MDIPVRIVPNDHSVLTLPAYAILDNMLNVPERDYRTFEEMCSFFAVSDGNTIHGVAVCGRPVSRYLDNGFTCEILRVCTDGTYNACSMLYGACCRIAKAMGYSKIITYTLISENGASLKASGFINEGKAGGTNWTGKRNKQQNIPHELKNRWMKNLQ